MSDIKLDYTGNTGDLDLTGHQISLVTGEQAIEQHLRIRLQFFLGEHFLDERLGVPYYRDILIKNPNLDLIRSIFKETIEETPGIRSADQVEVSIGTNDALAIPTHRTLTLTFKATMDTGEELVFEPFILEL